ncbi:hypothetical protein D3C81_1144550 [compost metagenome]
MANISAISYPAFYVAFGIQLVISTHHAVAREPEHTRQVSSRRQARAAAQAPIQHASAQRLIELLTQPSALVEDDPGGIEWQYQRALAHRIGPIKITVNGS